MRVATESRRFRSRSRARSTDTPGAPRRAPGERRCERPPRGCLVTSPPSRNPQAAPLTTHNGVLHEDDGLCPPCRGRPRGAHLLHDDSLLLLSVLCVCVLAGRMLRAACELARAPCSGKALRAHARDRYGQSKQILHGR